MYKKKTTCRAERFPKATGEVGQCWYNEIAALAVFLVDLNLLLVLCETGKCKF